MTQTAPHTPDLQAEIARLYRRWPRHWLSYHTILAAFGFSQCADITG